MDRIRIGNEGWQLCNHRDCEGCNFVPCFARGLRERQLRICIEPIRGGARTAAVEPEPEETAQAAVKKASPKTWVEFEVVDMEDKPVSGYRFRVVLPDGAPQEGTLDKTGKRRFEKIDFDNSVFSLSDLDQEAWERVD